MSSISFNATKLASTTSAKPSATLTMVAKTIMITCCAQTDVTCESKQVVRAHGRGTGVGEGNLHSSSVEMHRSTDSRLYSAVKMGGSAQIHSLDTGLVCVAYIVRRGSTTSLMTPMSQYCESDDETPFSVCHSIPLVRPKLQSWRHWVTYRGLFEYHNVATNSLERLLHIRGCTCTIDNCVYGPTTQLPNYPSHLSISSRFPIVAKACRRQDGQIRCH